MIDHLHLFFKLDSVVLVTWHPLSFHIFFGFDEIVGLKERVFKVQFSYLPYKASLLIVTTDEELVAYYVRI